MPVVRIETLDDKRLDAYRSLKLTNETRWRNEFVAEGQTLLERMLSVRWPLVSVVMSESRFAKWQAPIPEGVPVYVLPGDMLRHLVGFDFHRGVVACGQRPVRAPLDLSLPTGSSTCRIIVLVDVHDPVNVGSILRSSLAFGATGVLLSAKCADPFSRRVLRVSMGASFMLPITVSADISEDLSRLSREGIELVAAVAHAGEGIQPATPNASRLGIVLGSEGHGLPQDILRVCQHQVCIPMAPGADSLNVAVAAGILLYQVSTK